MEILLSKAKPSTQLNRIFEVSTCRHVKPSTSIAHYNETYKNHRLRSVYLLRSDYMLVFQIVCLLIGTVFFRGVSIFDIFSSRYKLHWLDDLFIS